MNILIDLFYSVILIWSWILLIKYRRNVKSWTWNFYWAEKYIWSWWTYIILMLVWLFMIFWWAIYPFWWLEMLFWVESSQTTLRTK